MRSDADEADKSDGPRPRVPLGCRDSSLVVLGGPDALTLSRGPLSSHAFNGKGADIIVDDVGYLTEPFFQDGVIAQAVNAAAKKGVIYFSSAGNSADAHYELPYTDTVPGSQGLFPLDVHDFGQAQGGPPGIAWDGLVAGAGTSSRCSCNGLTPSGPRATITTSISSTRTGSRPETLRVSFQSALTALIFRTARATRWSSRSSSTRPAARP